MLDAAQKKNKTNLSASGLKSLRLLRAETNVKQKRRHRTSSKLDNLVLELDFVPA